MKVKYLEFLASKGRKKKFIYEELVKEYLKGVDSLKIWATWLCAETCETA